MFILMIFSLLAAEAKTTGELSTLSGVQSIVLSAIENHPKAKGAAYKRQQADGLVQSSRQIPNPVLEANYSETDNLGLKTQTTGVRLLFPIEQFGGKRSARIEKVSAEADLLRARAQQDRESIALNTLLAVYRLRQINEELELTQESLETFRNVKKTYQKRKSLGPQQSVSLDIFSLAEADYSMRLSALESEQSQLVNWLSLAVGKNIDVNNIKLPVFKKNWPKLTAVGNVKGPEAKVLMASKRLAAGRLSVEQSDAWPDLAIGPTYSTEKQFNDNINTVGVTLEMSLPLFNQNGGSKMAAQAESDSVEYGNSMRLRNLELQRKNLVETYNRVSKRLSKIDPDKLGHAKHRRIHTFLKRGVVEAALVIESHRQIVEFREHTNEQELVALKTLWQVRSLDGELLEKIKTEEL